jgi:hypothetical protein
MLHVNHCLMVGRVSPRGAQLRYAENGTPLCSFVLEIDELSQGKVYTGMSANRLYGFGHIILQNSAIGDLPLICR